MTNYLKTNIQSIIGETSSVIQGTVVQKRTCSSLDSQIHKMQFEKIQNFDNSWYFLHFFELKFLFP